MTECTLLFKNLYFRILKQNNQTFIRISDVLEASGFSYKKAKYDIYKPLLHLCDKYRFGKTGGGGSLIMEKSDVINFLFPAIKSSIHPGIVYCFQAKHVETIYKVGCTTDWNHRARCYTGMNTIGTVLLKLPVPNYKLAEKKLKNFAETVMLRIEGREWFHSDKGIDSIQDMIDLFLIDHALNDGTEMVNLEAFIESL